MHHNLSIGDTFDRAWQLSKKHGLLFAVVLFVVSLLTGGFAYPPSYWTAVFSGDSAEMLRVQQNMGYVSVGSIFGNLITFVVSVGVTIALLRIVRGTGAGLTWDCYKLPLMTYVKYFAYGLLMAIIVGIGFVLLIVPGLYLMGRLNWGIYYLLEHPEAGIGEAFSWSWKATAQQSWTLVGLLLTGVVVTLAGLLACCIGLYFTAVIAQFAYVLVYVSLNDNSSALEA